MQVPESSPLGYFSSGASSQQHPAKVEPDACSPTENGPGMVHHAPFLLSANSLLDRSGSTLGWVLWICDPLRSETEYGAVKPPVLNILKF